MASTKASGRPPADVFLPAEGAAGGGGGTPKIMGINRNLFIVLAVGAVVAAYLIYRHYQQNQSNAAAQSAASSTGIDPATGFPSGSPEDIAALGGLPPGGGGSGSSGDSSGNTPPSEVSSSDFSALSSAIEALASSISTNGNQGSQTGVPVTINVVPSQGSAAPNSKPAPGAGTPTVTPAQAVAVAQKAAAQAAAPITPGVVSQIGHIQHSAASNKVASQIAAARPGGTSSNKQQGTYAIH